MDSPSMFVAQECVKMKEKGDEQTNFGFGF